MTERFYTTSTAFLEALAEAGVTYVFANLGSDHPGLIEALARARAEGRADTMPKIVVCPHETVAVSAAHAYAMVTGQPQAVAVHVDAGTQNLGGGVNNAMRGRVPVLIFAGTVHGGYQYHSVSQNPLLAEADVVLVIDSDVPWIPAVNRPSDGAAIYYVDVDPLKSQMQLWHVPARRFAAANSKVATEQIAAYVRDNDLADPAAVSERRAVAVARHQRVLAEREAAEQPKDGVITGEYLTACVRRLLEGEDALILTEVVTNSRVVAEHLRPNKPGSVLHHGGGSLGWSGGAAVGAKLAYPERTVVSLVGDGSFLFSVPSSALWVQRRYGTPALTIIYDNGGWAGPKFSTLMVHPEGAAAAANEFYSSLEPEADLPGVALAAGAGFGATVSDPGELPQVLKDALAVVHGGRSAVVSVRLPGA